MEVLTAGALQPFGPAAVAYASRLPESLAAIIADATDPARALCAAVHRRRAGEPFYVCPLLDDNRTVVAMNCAQFVIAQLSGDARRLHFDALAQNRLTLSDNVQQSAVQAIDQRAIATMNDLVMAGDALLVRSRTECDRLRRQLRRLRPWIAVAPGIDASVPNVRASGRGGPVVVWAPQFHASRLGVLAYALENLLRDSIIVCAGGDIPGVRARFVQPSVQVLSQASLIVDASISDPATAIALAGCGAPLVCASTSGAHEFIDGVLLYDPWDWRSIHAAISAAYAGSEPYVSSTASSPVELEETLRRAGPPKLEHEPLVSIIVPTYNRPKILEECLRRLDTQLYGNFEVVVVNDAGEAVEDVVAKFSRARLINRAQNGGPMRAENDGIAAARGEYLTFLPDDDVYFPDFLPRAVAAMVHSGMPVANSNGVIRFWQKVDSVWKTVGYRWLSYLHLDRVEQQWAGNVSLTGMMFHRSIFEKHGGLNAESTISDFELTLALSEHYDFVHVDYLTNEWNYLMDRSSYSHRVGPQALLDYQDLFARHPSCGSRIIEQGRASSLKWFETQSKSYFWEPALYLAEPVA